MKKRTSRSEPAEKQNKKSGGKGIRLCGKICLCIMAGTALVCFGSFLISSFLKPVEAEIGLLSLAAVLAVSVPLLFRKFWKKILPKGLFRVLSVLYCVGITFFFVTFAALCIRIASYSAAPPDNTGETVVVVYGCRTRNGKPRSMLRERLDCAYALLAENPQALCIVSGAVDIGETETEGAIMARYLTEEKGIAPERVIVEGYAEDTKGNIRNSLALIRENGWEERNIISVSSDFHMPRIEYLCSRYGMECSFSGSHTKPFSVLLPTLTREYMSYVKMLVLNNYT